MSQPLQDPELKWKTQRERLNDFESLIQSTPTITSTAAIEARNQIR
jgi:hypothetical protein